MIILITKILTDYTQKLHILLSKENNILLHIN